MYSAFGVQHGAISKAKGPCWKGYKQEGMKPGKGGSMVPNCVPEKVSKSWQTKDGKNPKGGLNEKGRKSYESENPGSNLKPPVKRGDNPRRASFLARMGNMPGPERKPNGEPTRLLLSLNAWGASSKADAKKKAAAISKMSPDQSSVSVKKPLKTVSSAYKKINTGDTKVPKEARTFMSGSVIRAYNESRDNKIRAAGKQMAGAAAGGLTGGTLGTIAGAIAAKKIKGINSASKIFGRTISADKKMGYAASTAGGLGAGVGGASANYATLQSTKKNKKYKFDRKAMDLD
jgi:hypothetical protein